MPDDRPTYRFRWQNIDLERFRAQRQSIADELRRGAEARMKAADVIEAEIRAWVDALEEPPEENTDAP